MKILKALYIQPLFFYVLLTMGGLFLVSFFVKWFYFIVLAVFVLFLFVVVIDALFLFAIKDGLHGERVITERLSNGDENFIEIRVHNRYPFPMLLELIDEIPFQFQNRDFNIRLKVKPNEKREIKYSLRPTRRGEYLFGKLNIYVQSPIRMIARRYLFSEDAVVAAYPSFIQLRKYDMLAFSDLLTEYGLKRIRRIGHTMEFEQIKEYVRGDDIRTINWKATSKKNALMVNQYQDEKSQYVYQIIDTGRTMQMPFGGLSLLDYAINSTLAFSNIVLKKNDRAGMFTFSRKVENFVLADRKLAQMEKLMGVLYRISTDFKESDFSRLFVDLKQLVKQRSLIMLYTNFDTVDGLQRQLPFLKNIAKNHFLVVVFFENSELSELVHLSARTEQKVFDKVIAEKFAFEKKNIVNELKKHGIQSILTQPHNLTIATINKYLELKARGII